ncbi:hypothetical protein STRTUCAR8_00414, partial [Streptomyces turgidiscabies Car8]
MPLALQLLRPVVDRQDRRAARGQGRPGGAGVGL